MVLGNRVGELWDKQGVSDMTNGECVSLQPLHRNQQGRSKLLLFSSLGVQIATIIAAIVLGVRAILTPVEAVILATLFIILENIIILVVGREKVLPILRDIGRKSIFLRHQEIALDDWILRDEYSRAVKDFSTRITDLASGKFTLALEDVPPLSLRVVDSLEKEAFATVVIGLTDQFFDTDAGREYLQKCYEAAKRISGPFTRLFIIGDFVDISPRVYDIIEQHVKEKIRVLVATRAELTANRLDPESDFGLWDRHCLMQMKAKPGVLSANLDVYVGGPEIQAAINSSQKMTRTAKTWKEFFDGFCRPLNENEWLDLLPKFVSFPVPAGPSLEDVTRMGNLASTNGSYPRNVLVLGYTKKIVDYLAEQGCQRIHVLDVGVYRPLRHPPKVSFFKGNWLTWKPEEAVQYELIVGDDVLTNLGVWQCHLFFRNMAELLRASGLLVVRNTGQYSTKHLALPGFQETLNELKKRAPVTEELLIAKLWPMFHSPEFYDEHTRSFDLRDWNRHLQQVEPNAFAQSGDMTTLRLNYTLKQTSLPFADILGYAGKWFDLIGQAPADESYTRLNDGFENFYRILCFGKK